MNNGLLKGDASEWDGGGLLVSYGYSHVEGNAFERGEGFLTVEGILDGDAEEWGKGNIVITCAFWSCDGTYGFVDGNAIEWNDGNIVIDPGTTLNGYAEENGPGEVIDNR